MTAQRYAEVCVCVVSLCVCVGVSLSTKSKLENDLAQLRTTCGGVTAQRYAYSVRVCVGGGCVPVCGGGGGGVSLCVYVYVYVPLRVCRFKCLSYIPIHQS